MRGEILEWFRPFFMDYTNDRDGKLYEAIKYILQRLSSHLHISEGKWAELSDTELQEKLAQDPITPPTPEEVATAIARFRDSESTE